MPPGAIQGLALAMSSSFRVSAYTQPGAARGPDEPQTHPDQSHQPRLRGRVQSTVRGAHCQTGVLCPLPPTRTRSKSLSRKWCAHFTHFFMVFWSQASL